MEGDVQYLQRRAQQEREAAMKAPHPKARAAHLELARRFEDFADAAIVRDRHFAPDLLSA
jgi:hypothetical protein